MDPFEGIDEVVQQPPKKSKKQSGLASLKKLPVDMGEIARSLNMGTGEQTPKQPTENKQAANTKKAQLIYAIQKIGKNKRFGDYLRDECGHRFDEAYLSKKSVSELEFEIEKNNVALSHKSNTGMIDVVIKNGMRIGETVVSKKTNLMIEGTTEACFEDEHFLDLLERIKIRHNTPFMQMPPELELALTIAQTAMFIHSKNRFKSSLTTDLDLDKEVSE